ncbi:MAG: hypothetical protein K0R39_3695 [Symbiobacteriaceae bacterium]|jgi:uncharacterized protein YjgD (DUF1641 family)|nr:hypothetical protein [Symbiobacteriaceae bacterium]
MDVTERTFSSTADLAASPELFALVAQIRTSAPALTHLVKRVDELHQSGALDTLLDMTQVLQAAKVSMGDAMIHRMADLVRVLGEMVDVVTTCGLPEKLPAVVEAVGAARADAEADQSSLGVVGLVKALRQPETQFALKFVLALSRRLPEAAK